MTVPGTTGLVCAVKSETPRETLWKILSGCSGAESAKWLLVAACLFLHSCWYALPHEVRRHRLHSCYSGQELCSCGTSAETEEEKKKKQIMALIFMHFQLPKTEWDEGRCFVYLAAWSCTGITAKLVPKFLQSSADEMARFPQLRSSVVSQRYFARSIEYYLFEPFSSNSNLVLFCLYFFAIFIMCFDF